MSHVRVYEYDGCLIGFKSDKISTVIAAGDKSGVTVSINSAGDIVAIGAYLNDGNGVDSVTSEYIKTLVELGLKLVMISTVKLILD